MLCRSKNPPSLVCCSLHSCLHTCCKTHWLQQQQTKHAPGVWRLAPGTWLFVFCLRLWICSCCLLSQRFQFLIASGSQDCIVGFRIVEQFRVLLIIWNCMMFILLNWTNRTLRLKKQESHLSWAFSAACSDALTIILTISSANCLMRCKLQLYDCGLANQLQRAIGAGPRVQDPIGF